MMQESPNVIAMNESDEREILAGKLGAMLDGWLQSFEYDGLTVKRSYDSIYVEDHGGRAYVGNSTVASLIEWIETKAEYYGEDQ